MNTFLAVALLCVFCTEVIAAPCMKHDDFMATLKNRWGETAQVQALSADGRMMEIFANPATGTWSALMTKPDGEACIVAGGDRFASVKPGDPA